MAEDSQPRGREVSCRAVAFLLDELEARGLPASRLTEGTSLSVVELRNKEGRLGWEDFCQVMEKTAETWSEEELIALGRRAGESRWLRAFSLPVRLLYSVEDMYRAMVRPRVGPSEQLFSCIRNRVFLESPGRLRLELRMIPGYPPCRQFLLICQGSLEALPTAAGFASAKVELVERPAGAHFLIEHPIGGGILAGVRRALFSRAQARAAAQELEEAYVLLHRRHLELESENRERRRAEAELQRLVAELESKNQELEHFTYTVSHDLKSPLVTILGFVGALEKEMSEAGPPINEDLERIRDAARAMHRLLDELLELSRAGRRVSAPEEVDLSQLVASVVSRFRAALEGRAIRVEISPDLPRVMADRNRLSQVVQNLLENAVKFRDDEGGDAWIRISARRERQWVILELADNGVGIEPRHHQRVFELFQRLDPATKGSGVGLALVKRIAEAHGGEAWVDSAGEGHGSTFCVALPRERAGGRRPDRSAQRIGQPASSPC